MKAGPPTTDARTIEPFMIRLVAIFDDMSEGFTRIADHYGFTCRGCADNCCRTRFHHHTLAEYLYLKQGVESMPEGDRTELSERAAMAGRRTADKAPIRVMCPLNVDGRCTLYNFRPMICRLHGLPHELRKLGHNAAFGPGCGEFDARFGRQQYQPFDRTPFYIELARLEGDLRKTIGYAGKIKMTVAEMIIDYHL
ncbi:MAG: hypothetical protein HKM93_22660 [Desulfobacteraceae bacterium]|nr:hypothetical protein [Desulfobacteraceae bacterium]